MNVVYLKIFFWYSLAFFPLNKLLSAEILLLLFQQLVHAHLIYVKETTTLAIMMLERIDCDDTTGARDVKHVIQNNDGLV